MSLINVAPRKLAKIKFLNDKPIKPGVEIAYNKIANAPLVTWDFETRGLYTLLLVSPDAKIPKNNARMSICHWLVVNIPENNIHKGQILIDYVMPKCSTRRILQRFILLIFKQTDMVTTNKFIFQITKEGYIQVQSDDKTTKYKFANVVAGNYFTIRL